MKREIVNQLGIDLIQYTHKSCTAVIAEDPKWATIYSIESSEKGKGHASEMLEKLKRKYKNRSFGCSVALNETMSHLLKKFKIKEYA